MPRIGVVNRIFLEHKRHKRTIMALNSSILPVSLPSPAMRSNTGKDVYVPLGSPSTLTQFLKQRSRILLSCVLFHQLSCTRIPMGHFVAAPD